MTIMMQQDFFKNLKECEIESKVSAVEKIVDRVRRGTYARINSQDHEILDLKTRLEILERHICKGELL